MNEAINADEMAKMAVIWKSVGDEKRADDWVRRAVRVSFGVNRNLCDTLIDGGYYTQAAQIAIREKDDSGIERIARRQALRFGGNPPEWILNIAAPSLRAKALISWAHAISPVMEYMIYMMSDALGVK